MYEESWSMPYQLSLAGVWAGFAAGNETHHLHTVKRQGHSLNRQISELLAPPAVINEPEPIKIIW